MAFDQTTRNRLARFVGDCRGLLTEEFTRQLQSVYGMDPKNGDVAEIDSLTLTSEEFETARLLRDTMEHYLASADTSTAAKAKKARIDVLGRIVREQAFTVLNRLCALRMSEARGLLVESIGKGYQSKGFQLYKQLAGPALGETGDAYRCFLFCVFDEFGIDMPVLFDRFSPEGRLFPREAALLEVLGQINDADIDPLWAEDETIGWIYQYFNSKDERKAMRDASQAPRNSRELAVRNQFFTPRYVVEFLTDNTLGRIWYEMTQAQTGLKDSCRYLVRRPSEIFLAEGEQMPEQDKPAEDLSQEELLKQPVHIPFRPLKDPRDIKMLDPACGSMHFGLYAFDLFERIYAEAWDLEAERGVDAFVRPEGLKPLHETYDIKEAFLRDVPRLIIEQNIHGIDIDPRAVQIAGLSLWLRAQKSWAARGLQAADRPQIERSNIVCAEPMPGEVDMLEDFLKDLRDDRLESLIRRVLKVPENQKVRATARMADALCDLVRTLWKEMELAGEMGGLLKIEVSLADAIARGKEEWEAKAPLFRVVDFGLTEDSHNKPAIRYYKTIPGEENDFWTRAEALVLYALNDFTERATGLNASRQRMFARDAARGFSFIDLARRRFDTVLMNPPFGLVPVQTKRFYQTSFPDDWTEIYACFVSRGLSWLEPDGGSLGAITSNLWMYTKHQSALRTQLASRYTLQYLVDLGGGVLDDATVDTALTVATATKCPKDHSVLYHDLHRLKPNEHDTAIAEGSWLPRPLQKYRGIPLSPFCFHIPLPVVALWHGGNLLEPDLATVVTGNSTFDNYRFLRLHSEVPIDRDSDSWIPYDKGGYYQPYFNPTPLMWRFSGVARENRVFQVHKYGTDAQVKQSITSWKRPGICYSRACLAFSPRLLPAGSVMNEKSICVFVQDTVNPLAVLAVLSSTHIQDLLYVFGRHRNVENRAVGGLPIPQDTIRAAETTLSHLARRAVELMEFLESTLELSAVFARPALSGEVEAASDSLLELTEQIDEVVGDRVFGGALVPSSPPRRSLLKKHVLPRFSSDGHAMRWVSNIVGSAIGRWDVSARFSPCVLARNNDLPESLPRHQPGMHTQSGDPRVFSDDPSSAYDIARHFVKCRETLSRAVGENNLAGVPDDPSTIRELLQSNFFDKHLADYSASARVAPIYWPLSSATANFTLWVYYHHLSSQTLYTCVNDFVEPKLKQVSDDVSRLRGKSNRSSAEEKELERLSDLELELKDFRDELLRIAKFWKPNLNDGVQITAAPLWKLFQHRQWQARLKETWEKLEAGEYDWAHLALSIWPDRVVRASHNDRSYAIAHDLEDQLWHEVELQKKTKGGKAKKVKEWQPRKLSEAQLDAIVTEVKAR